MSAPGTERGPVNIKRIQSRFLVVSELIPEEIVTGIKSGALPAQQIEHGFDSHKTRYTQRTLPSGAVVFEERPYDATAIGPSFSYRGMIAEWRTRRKLAPKEFEEAWPGTEGQRLSKSRYEVDTPDGPFVDLDVYQRRPDMPVKEGELDMDGQMLAVVQFDTFAEAEAYIAPDFDGRLPWLGSNVTDNVSTRKLAKGRTWHLKGTANFKTLRNNPSSE
jgi:hypothetical protein